VSRILFPYIIFPICRIWLRTFSNKDLQKFLNLIDTFRYELIHWIEWILIMKKMKEKWKMN